MTKRQVEKEAAQKKLLRQRVADIAIGVGATEFARDEDIFWQLENLARFIGGLNEAFRAEEYVWGYWNLQYWETLDKATDFLWEGGARP